MSAEVLEASGVGTGRHPWRGHWKLGPRLCVLGANVNMTRFNLSAQTPQVTDVKNKTHFKQCRVCQGLDFWRKNKKAKEKA